MGWRVNSVESPALFVEWRDGSGIADEEGVETEPGGLGGDPGTLAYLRELIDAEVLVALTVTGPFRDVFSEDDQVGVYLLAVQGALPGPHEIIGTPPSEATAPIPEGATS